LLITLISVFVYTNTTIFFFGFPFSQPDILNVRDVNAKFYKYKLNEYKDISENFEGFYIRFS